MISGDILILSANNVRDVVSRVDPIEFIHLMGRVFRAFSDKAPISAPHRTSIESTSCTSLFMPARIDGFGGTAIKIVSVPRQSVDGLPATTLIMDEESGGVKAVINARDLTALRTAAGSTLSTLAVLNTASNERRSPRHLVLFGAGAQVYYHASLHLSVFSSLTHCTVINRIRNERLTLLIAKLQAEHPHANITSGAFADSNLEDVVRSADIICTATPSTSPLFRSHWVKPSVHIVLVGSYKPEMREIEDDLVLKADTVLVDSRDACSLEAGELISSGIKKEDMVELGQLVGDDGAPDPAKVERLVKTSSITVFKSVGVGIQDVAIAHAVLGRAQALGFVSSIPYD